MNAGITFGFFGFWHCVLYGLGWSERPFMPNRKYRLSKVLHNSWYTLMGVVQYTGILILFIVKDLKSLLCPEF